MCKMEYRKFRCCVTITCIASPPDESGNVMLRQLLFGNYFFLFRYKPRDIVLSTSSRKCVISAFDLFFSFALDLLFVHFIASMMHIECITFVKVKLSLCAHFKHIKVKTFMCLPICLVKEARAHFK